MLVSFSKALKSANTVSVFTGWKLEFNKWLNLCYFLKESVAREGFWIFFPGETRTNLGKKERRIIIFKWLCGVFFIRCMAKHKYQFHHWILLGKKTLWLSNQSFLKYIAERD